MQPAIREIYNTAIKLPFEMQSLLAEKLVGNVEAHIDPLLERQHILIAKRRRDEYRSGKVQAVDSAVALKRVRKAVMK